MIRSGYGQQPQSLSEPTITQARLESICKAVKTEIRNQSPGRSDCITPTQWCSFGGPEGTFSKKHSEDEKALTRTEKASQPNIKLEKFTNFDGWPQKPACGGEPQEEHHSREERSGELSVTAIDVLSRLLRIDIQVRLLEDPCRCLASTAQVPPARCTTYTEDENKQKVMATLDTLLKLKVTPEKMSFTKELFDFVDLTFCGKFHSWRVRQSLGLWCLDKDLEFQRAISTSQTKDISLIQESLMLQSYKSFDKARTTEAVRNTNVRNTTTNAQDLHKMPSLPSHHNLYPFTVRARNIISPARTNIRRISKKNLTPKALKTGYLYVYRLIGLPGEQQLYKIGYTWISVWQRVRQWEKRCGHKVEIIYPRITLEGLAVKHVYRLEQLVHMDLKIYQRHEINCWKCSARQGGKKKTHREWFRTCEYRINAVILKWRAWMEQSPYEENNGVWQLKEKFEEQLDGLCTPAQDLCTCGNF